MMRPSLPLTGLRRRGARVAVVAVAGLVLAGCGNAGFSGLYNTSLPGGADLGDHPYAVNVEFSDVLDLVPQASVKASDVPIGRVDRIELAPDTRSATVRVLVNGDVELPANADAELRQSSLLGEKFIELGPPRTESAKGRLADGATIPLSRTNRYPELEEIFGALSVLLSGGGVDRLRTIAHELNEAFSGNEAEIKALLTRVDHLATELDGQKGEIVRAIDGLNRLSSTLKGETGRLNKALDGLAPGMRVVAEQRDQIVDMLESLHTLSDVTVDTIGKSRRQLVANLRALEPTLRKLGDAGQSLPEALKILPTYPLPYNAGGTMKGDFANVDAVFNMNLDTLLANQQNSGTPLVPTPSPAAPPSGADLPLPPVLPGLPALPGASLPGMSAPAQGDAGGLLGDLWGLGR